MGKKRIINLLAGPLLFFLSFFFLPESVFAESVSRAAIGTVLWMAYWWITAPVDFAVTAFLPIAVNAVFPMAEMKDVIANYASETILLLLGASILTVSWEKTGLDKRIAAKCLSLIGSNLRRQIIFWFLISAVLSAFLPNAVVCATMIPIAFSMLKYVGEDDIKNSKKGSMILLTVVYAAGIGGLATPLGGAMNLITVDYIQKLTGKEYMYTSWVVHFLPVMLVLLVSNVLFLALQFKKDETLGVDREYFKNEYKKFPKVSKEELFSFLLFVAAALASFTRQLYQNILPGLKPAYVFIICAIVSFLITGKDGSRLIVWKHVQKKIVWELIYIFAGGLAAGTLINGSGAAQALGAAVSKTNLDGGFLTVFVIIVLTVILSDVTSNTATAAVAMPIVISIIQGIGKDPIPYIYIASIGVNLSYMLPTSIRAIPVGYGLEPKFMFKQGLPLTIIVIILMSALGFLLLNYWPAFSVV